MAEVDRNKDLGLSSAKTLAELHGGSITAASDGTRMGAAFTVRLPSGAEPASPSARHGATPANPKAPGRRILVVEDDPDTARVMMKLLGFDGHVVLTARDDESARVIARSFLPEIILLDVGLPGGDGCELAEAFRADPTLSNPLLVVISGLPAADHRSQRGLGAEHHFVKPIDFDALTQLIARRG